MIDFIVFLSTQFFKFFEWLDQFTIIGTLSLLRVFIILVLFMIAFKFLKGGEKH